MLDNREDFITNTPARAAVALCLGVHDGKVALTIEVEPDDYWYVDADPERARQIAATLIELAEECESNG